MRVHFGLSEGTVRDLLIGIQYVGRGGRTIRTGGRVVKNVAGYDLMKLMTGSFGTLGIMTEVAFKVRPIPGNYTLALASLPDVARGVRRRARLSDAAPFDASRSDEPASQRSAWPRAADFCVGGISRNGRRGRVPARYGARHRRPGRISRRRQTRSTIYGALRDFDFGDGLTGRAYRGAAERTGAMCSRTAARISSRTSVRESRRLMRMRRSRRTRIRHDLRWRELAHSARGHVRVVHARRRSGRRSNFSIVRTRRAQIDARAESHVRSCRRFQSRMLRRRDLMAAAAPSQPVRNVVDYELLFDCVHCGLCLEACPTYAISRAEMDSPRGRIYLMKSLAEGRLELDADAARHLDLCLGCRGCETACPSGVHYGRLIEDARTYVEHQLSRGPLDALRRALIGAVFPYPVCLRMLLAPLALELCGFICAAQSKRYCRNRLREWLELLRRIVARPGGHVASAHRAIARCAERRRASWMRRAGAGGFGKSQ